MFARLRALIRSRTLRRRLLLVGIVLVFLWVLFFDSHSVVKRIRWSAETEALEEANTALQEEIEQLEADIETASSPEVVEKVAREQYGMRRPGETVYRAEKPETTKEKE